MSVRSVHGFAPTIKPTMQTAGTPSARGVSFGIASVAAQNSAMNDQQVAVLTAMLDVLREHKAMLSNMQQLLVLSLNELTDGNYTLADLDPPEPDTDGGS